VPEMPQAAEPGAAGTQPDNPEGARSGGISKRVPEMPQAAEPGAAGTQPDNPEGAQSGPQEQGTEARGPAE
jgi:hypothetical protein